MHIAHVANFSDAPALSPTSSLRARGRMYRGAGHEFTIVVPARVRSTTITDYGTVLAVPISNGAAPRGYGSLIADIQRSLNVLEVDNLELADKLSYRALGVWAHNNSIRTILFAEEVNASLSDPVLMTQYDRVATSTFDRLNYDPTVTGERQRMHSTVDIEQFSPLRYNSTRRSQKAADLHLVCATPLTGRGSADLALDALRILTSKGHRAHLTVLGDGPLKGRIRRRSQQLPVRLLSTAGMTLRDRAEILATADISLVTSSNPSAPQTVLESLASGTPCVVVGEANAGLALENGAGLVTAINVSRLAQAIQILSEEPTERRRQAARRAALPFDCYPVDRALLDLHNQLDPHHNAATATATLDP